MQEVSGSIPLGSTIISNRPPAHGGFFVGSSIVLPRQWTKLRGSQFYGILLHMKALSFIRDRRVLPDGDIIEIVVWKVPQPVPPTTHGWKYRLFYGRAGRRIVGYDNERGKGDHRHVDGEEKPYTFVSITRLLDDFEADIAAMRGSTP
jgi:hypothetical protein